jgi:hypothetical protein
MDAYLENIVATGGIQYEITEKFIFITRDRAKSEWIIAHAEDQDGEIRIKMKNAKGESEIIEILPDENWITVKLKNDILVLTHTQDFSE